MKKYILFDNDGVLVDTEQWYFRANVEVLRTMNITLDEKRYMEIMTKGKSAFLLAQEAGFDAVAIEKYRSKRNELYQHYIRNEEIEIKGVSEIIRDLSHNYKMGIVTSARREDFELIHNKRTITKYMQFVLCSKEYERPKPYPDPYLKGLNLFNAKKDETIIVEDSARGLHSAINAEIECVIVHNHFTSTHDFSGATHKIQTLSELKKLL